MSLGDVYPTGLSGKITFILLTWYYIDKFKFSWVKISCSLLIIMFNYQFTDSKVDILTLILLNMVLIFNKLVFYWCSFKYIRVIVGFTPILWTLSLFFGVSKYLMGSSLAYKLDGVFTNRIMYTSQAIQNYSPYTLFGQNIPMTGAGGLNGYANTIFNNIKYFFLDSSYAYVIFCYGILFYLLIILVYYLSIQNQFVVDGSAELAILIFISSLHWFI
ncbi:hypothetical protein J6K93_10220, partial [Leuconostoc mesenteroides]|uniref:hypothetical protein n=1 Tax=Leuconostoc mesenteroides TaxID=1245 RepID=UPI001CC10AAF